MMTTDDPLAEWASTDDPGVLTALVRRHSDAVYGYLARRGGRQLADDLLGEVWLRALRSRHSYDPSWSDPRPWLYGIARNALCAHWRLRSHDPRPAQELVADPWAEVDTGLDAARIRPALLDALACLSDDDREVLMLVAWEQLTPAEAAISLGIPQGTARSRLRRARNILQRQLDTLPFPNCPQEV